MSRGLSPAEVFERIREVLADEFEILGDVVRPEAQLVDDLDLDSLDLVSLVQQIGDEIGVGLDAEDIRECKTLADLAGQVSLQLSTKPFTEQFTKA